MDSYQTLDPNAKQPLAGNELGGAAAAGAGGPPPGQWDPETATMGGGGEGAAGGDAGVAADKGLFERQNLLGLLTVVGTFQWINGAVNCSPLLCHDLGRYDVSLGVVSCVFSGIWFLLDRFRPGVMPGLAMQILSGFLALWWTSGALIVTSSIKSVAGNEYFCIWGCAVISLYLLFYEVAEGARLFQRGKDLYEANRHLCTAIFASVMVIAGSIGAPSTYAWARWYGLSAGIVSAVLCSILLFGVLDKLEGNAKRVVMGFHFVWWLCATGILTVPSEGTFTVAGNGYFGCWLALYASAMLFIQQRG